MTFGFAGLGDIGLPIALRLQEVVGPISVWNRSPAKAEAVVAQGGRLLPSPRSLAQDCTLVGLCLTSDDAVEQVVFGSDGLLADHQAGKDLVIVNLSTGDPRRSQDFAARAARLPGVRWLDAPVSGGVPAARKGALTLFLGGDDETVSRAMPLLTAIGQHWTVMGPPGAGQTTKLCNQMIVATNLLAIAQAVALGREAGIDVAQLTPALRGGFADSTPLQIFGPRMAARNHEPRLGAISLMLKDVTIARSVARDLDAPAPLADFVATLYQSAGTTPGLSLDQDLSALVKLFERNADTGQK